MNAASSHRTDGPLQRPLLSAQERDTLNRGRWFAALSPSLRHDILRLGRITRYAHGELIAAQGEVTHEWFTCTSGAIRFRRTTAAGKQVTLVYAEPGIWVGEAEVLHGSINTYNAHAHGPTTVLSLDEQSLRSLLLTHPTFGEALLTLQARRMNLIYNIMEDLATLPLRARLAKRLLHLLHRFGLRDMGPGSSRAIGLSLAQDELACLVGGSRQRVNVELKWLEREGMISVRSRGIEVHDAARLQTLVDEASAESRAPGICDD